jgi:hypothetical protein
VQDSSEKLAQGGAGAREQVENAAEGVSEQGQGLFNDTQGGREGSSPQTFRQELAGIMREAAIEVLAPVARQATKYAAKYAVQRGPKLAQEKLMPRLRDTLESVQDAGGAGAFARDALGSGGGVLSRLGGGDEEEDESRGAWENAKAPLEEHVDVAVALQDAYEYFQQFGQHVNFMSDYEQVEEVPNERIVWESTNGLEAICVITFHAMADRLTRVMVTYEANPHGFQKATSALRLPRRVIRGDLLRFKSLVEVHPDEAEDLYEEPGAEDARDEEPAGEEESEPAGEEESEPADEEESEPAGEEESDGQDESESESEPEEEDEPAPAKARRRSPQQPDSRRRQQKEPARRQSSTKASAQSGSAQPRKRTVRSGSAQSGSAQSGSGGRREAQSASKKGRPSRTRGKG